jgi:3-oxoadipate enol-lactonase
MGDRMSAPSPTQWLDVPGGRLAYDRAGHGAPIVYLHAAIVDRRVWEREFQHRAGAHTVVRYDRRGLGESPPATAAYSEVADLHALFEALHLPPAVLVGNSMGGGLALDYALEHPAQVRALLLVAPGLSGWTPKMDLEYQPIFDADIERSAGMGEAWKAGRKDDALELLREYWAPAVEGPDRALVERMFRDNLEEIFTDRTARHAQSIDPPAAGRLHSVGVPTTVLFGSRDEPTCGVIARRIAHGIPKAKFEEVPGGDHLLHLSRPAPFGAALDALLVAATA